MVSICTCGLTMNESKIVKHMMSKRHEYLYNKLNGLNPFKKIRNKKLILDLSICMVRSTDNNIFELSFDDN